MSDLISEHDGPDGKTYIKNNVFEQEETLFELIKIDKSNCEFKNWHNKEVKYKYCLKFRTKNKGTDNSKWDTHCLHFSHINNHKINRYLEIE